MLRGFVIVSLMMRHLTVIVIFLVLAMVAVPAFARDKQYEAKQINLNIDGVLNEWGGSDIIVLDQLKDAGAALPDPNDFSGTAMVGWNSSDPDRIYFAATITDDVNEDTHPVQCWVDDSLEVMFDFQNDANLTQWNVDANGEESCGAAAVENIEWKVVNNGDQWIFEGAINPSAAGQQFEASPGNIIGLSIQFNDCENGVREHQIGWTAGAAWDAAVFGDLIFSADVVAAVEASDKVATIWGALKSQ